MTLLFFMFLYYLGFASSLFLAAINFPYLSLFLSIIISLFQILVIKIKITYPSLLKYLIVFTSIGYGVDSFLSLSHLITFSANPWAPFAAPWILALWLNFSILCLGIKKMLLKMQKYLFILAGLGFPITYLNCASLGIASFNNQVISAFIQGFIWAILFPIVFKKILLKVPC